ncbi:MAG: hypothetical protein IJ512_05910 [Ruminococcus sp.]|nr:hypothetical protein [Ruminococcus sp.]
MAKQKFTVEDILSEYGGRDLKTPPKAPTPSGKLEVHKMLNRTAAGTKPQYGSERPASFRRAEEESKINRIKREKSSRSDIEDSRAAAFQTLELMREKVSFVNSAAANPQTAPAQKNDKIEGYEGAVRVERKGEPAEQKGTSIKGCYQPKIRTMENSTRAREEQEEKTLSGKRRKPLENRYSYQKDSVRPEKKDLFAEEPETDEAKPFFFDLHHAGAAKFISREAWEERERRRRVAAIRRLRKKRMKMREADELGESEGAAVHIPNNESEIRTNINILKKTVWFRTLTLSLLFLAGLVLSVAEGTDSSFYRGLTDAIGLHGYSLLHLILGMAAILIAFPTVANGLRYLFTNRADSDSMAAAPIAASTLGAAVMTFFPESMARGESHLFVPVAVFILLMNAVGKHLIIRRAERSFSVLEQEYEQYVLTYVYNENDADALTRGIIRDYPILVSMRKARQMSDFLRYTYSADLGDRFSRKAVPIIGVVSLIIAAAITGIRSTVMPGDAVAGFFCSVFSMLLCGGCCSGVMLAANIPLNAASKKLSASRCALLGYQSVDEFYDSNALMVSAASLFPESAVTIDGMKPFGDAKIEEVLLEAASLVKKADSVLQHAFAKMVDEENGVLYPVDSVLYEEGYGISGWILNRRVLLGNREMMLAHNIEGLPNPLREAEYAGEGNEVLYCSVSGVLSAMILVKISANARMKRQLHSLMEENVVLVVKSVDSFLSQQYIAALYQIPENCLRVIPLAQHETFDRYAVPAERVSASVIASGRFEDTVSLLIQSRRIRRSAMTGVILQAVAVIIGLALALIYIGLSAYTSVTSQMFLIFQIAASVITAIAVKLK